MTAHEYHSTTTLSAIRAASPCKDGWEKLLNHLGKTKADDEPLDLLTILDSNGLDDALWVLSYGAPDCNRLARHFQAWCADQVLHIFEAERPDDMRVRDQITMLRNDDASDDDRAAARAAAGVVAWVAELNVAGAAAGSVARAAVRATSWEGAGAAALAAALAAEQDAEQDAARDATRAVAWHTARDATRAAQELQLRKMLAAPRNRRGG